MTAALSLPERREWTVDDLLPALSARRAAIMERIRKSEESSSPES